VLAFAAMFRAPQLPRTLEAALRDLGDKKPSVRESAVHDLVPHAEATRARVLDALTKTLRDEAPSVRAAAATALADVDGREAMDALLAAADDEAVEVRQMAIAALGEVGDGRAVARIEQALSDKRPEVRFQAAIAYPRAAADPGDAIEALVKATRDEDELVCHIALRMAEELAEGQGGADERLLVRARALLGHGTPLVRVAAAILLARSSSDEGASRADRAVREVLVAVALGELATREGADEAAAIELCGDLGLSAARPGLEKRAFGGLLLRRDRFAWHARVALAQMGHERARREILRELGSWDRHRRTLAVAAAGRARLAEARAPIAAMRGDADRADPHAVDEALAALAGDEAGAAAG
jgi:HEAT repeat protein